MSRSVPDVECMSVTSQSSHGLLSAKTQRLLHRMLSPLCGLDQHISFMMRNRCDPRFVTSGAELCGVHVLRNQPPPVAGAYHIGGSGVYVEEALIRTLAETAERYAQMVSEVSGRHPSVFATHDEMVAKGKPVLGFEKLQMFSSRQHCLPGFPFAAPSPNVPFSWIKASSLLDRSEMWVPAQVLLVGYVAKKLRGECWCIPSFTTGTAAHVTQQDSLRNALLELVQIDSAMGHWYSNGIAHRIMLDQRTGILQRVLSRQLPEQGPEVAFYWLRNADLPSFAIACTLRQPGGAIPAFVVGLGCDMRLVRAMYKALVEAVAVRQLAKVTLLDRALGRAQESGPINPDRILDLDSNVAYYATNDNQSVTQLKFTDESPVAASSLPPDWGGDADEAVRTLTESFLETGKQLFVLNLTTDDVRELGFWVMRVWSPDTLSLCLPSYPPEAHSRFRAYGGFHNAAPHPYP